MSWLIVQVWPWMAVSALAGAAITAALSTRRISVERQVAVVSDAEVVRDDHEVTAEKPGDAKPETPSEEQLSPFPVLAGRPESRPWEREELWSRPVQAAASAPAHAPVDEWSEAAKNWRTWADEAGGRPAAVDVDDDELFAQDRLDGGRSDDPEDVVRAPFATWSAGSPEPEPSGPESEDPFPYAEPVEMFPYAQPVEAAPLAAPEAERLERERLEAERVERERLEAERLERERLERERLEAERREAERREAQRLEAERRVAERLERERVEAEQREAERLEAERLEAERLERERLERERLEAERLEAERHEAERLEAERLEAERREAERLERERVEAERLEQERLEAERVERERLQVERLEAARVERERLEAERLERERLERERLEAERLEAERRERERVEAERREAERLERERLEAERLEAERLEAERLEAERREAARLEAERLEAERRERERVEAERREAERLERERFEAETITALDVDGAEDPSWLDESWRAGPYGPGSAYAPFDGSAPDGYTIKGHKGSMLYHTRRSRFYTRTQADVWFVDEAAARAAGFTRWDQRATAAHSVRQGSDMPAGSADA